MRGNAEAWISPLLKIQAGTSSVCDEDLLSRFREKHQRLPCSCSLAKMALIMFSGFSRGTRRMVMRRFVRRPHFSLDAVCL